MSSHEVAKKPRAWIGTAMVVAGALLLLGAAVGAGDAPREEGTAFLAGTYTAKLLFVLLGITLVVRGLKRRALGRAGRAEANRAAAPGSPGGRPPS